MAKVHLIKAGLKAECGREIDRIMLKDAKGFNHQYQWHADYCCAKCAKVAEEKGILMTDAQLITDAIMNDKLTPEQKKALAEVVGNFYHSIIEDTFGYDMRSSDTARYLRDQTAVGTHKRLGEIFKDIIA